MTRDGTDTFDVGAAAENRSTRRVFFTSSMKLIGAGALLAAASFSPAHVAAQDDGLGAGGRTGGESGDAEAASSLPAAQEGGLGAGGREGGDGGGGGGRRRRQDDADALGGVGAGGRTDPMVMAMPDTGVGTEVGGVAPMLLAAGAVGAAALAIRTREASTATGA